MPNQPAVHVTLSTFDTRTPRYRRIRENVPIGDFKRLTINDYFPYLGTPLHDACVHFIRDLEKHRDDDRVVMGLLLDESGSMEDNRDAVVQSVNEFINGMRNVDSVDPAAAGTVLAVIVTDGLENSSQEFTQADVSKLVTQKEADGFTFIFLGANIDAWEEGHKLGLSGSHRGQTVAFTSSPVGTQSAMKRITSDSASYLASTENYANMRAASSVRTVTEDGQEINQNVGPVPAIQVNVSATPWDPADALRKAKEVTGS